MTANLCDASRFWFHWHTQSIYKPIDSQQKSKTTMSSIERVFMNHWVATAHMLNQSIAHVSHQPRIDCATTVARVKSNTHSRASNSCDMDHARSRQCVVVRVALFGLTVKDRSLPTHASFQFAFIIFYLMFCRLFGRRVTCLLLCVNWCELLCTNDFSHLRMCIVQRRIER